MSVLGTLGAVTAGANSLLGLTKQGLDIYNYYENRDYNRALQQQMFNREDTAYQRAVNDAKAAGLSPLAVTSGAGAGSVVASPSSSFGAVNSSQLSDYALKRLSQKQQDIYLDQQRQAIENANLIRDWNIKHGLPPDAERNLQLIALAQDWVKKNFPNAYKFVQDPDGTLKENPDPFGLKRGDGSFDFSKLNPFKSNIDTDSYEKAYAEWERQYNFYKSLVDKYKKEYTVKANAGYANDYLQKIDDSIVYNQKRVWELKHQKPKKSDFKR